MAPPDPNALSALAASVVDRARRLGADIAEANVHAAWLLTVRVRRLEPELVQEAGQRSLSLRVIRDGRVGLTTTSDLSESGLTRSIADALELCALSEPDEYAMPADPAWLCHGELPDLDLFDPELDQLAADQALGLAVAAERAALDLDPRIELSEGSTFARQSSSTALVLSSGFQGSYTGTYGKLTVSPVALDRDGKRRRGYDFTAGRHLEDLEPAIRVGRTAARRTLDRLGSRPLPTCEAPVIFDPETAREVVGALASCLVGSAIWRQSSYLVERQGTVVASPMVTLVDDPLVPRGPGSRAFDGEGLASRRNLLIEQGVLKTFLLDCYSARKLGRNSTGSAGRNGATLAPGPSNLFIQAGTWSPENILAGTPRGLYVTEMMGFGFNPVTGDFSRGAAGFWIEDGRFAFPVSEVTISSNLDAMLKSIDRVGNDIRLTTATAAPTLRVSKMTLAGSHGG